MKTIKQIRDDYSHFAECADCYGYDPMWSVSVRGDLDTGEWFYEEMRGPRRWWAYVREFWLPAWLNFAIELVTNPRCHLLDRHDWESDDYCSPDSGYMGVTCKRCGQSHGQWMY